MDSLEYKIQIAKSNKIYITPQLYLYLGKTKKTWYHKINNTTKAIGEYPFMSESNALDLVMDKVSPKTLQELLEEFLIYKKQTIKANSFKRYQLCYNYLKKTTPLFYSKILEITTLQIINYYKTITKYELLFRTNILLKQVFNYAIIHSYLQTNPISSVPISMILPKPKITHRSYSIEPEFIKKLLSFIDRQNDKLKLAYTLLLVLGLRVNTLVQIKVSMFDFKKGLLIIPADIMKMGIEHILPINEELSSMIQSYINKYNITNYLFYNQINPYKHINPETFRIMLRKAGFSKDEITPHGFRAMISTICNDNEIDDKAIEWYLAHYETSSVSRAYNHSQGLSCKRKVLDFWWNWLENYR
jgi:integrase